MFYVIVSAEQLGLSLTPEEGAKIVRRQRHAARRPTSHRPRCRQQPSARGAAAGACRSNGDTGGPEAAGGDAPIERRDQRREHLLHHGAARGGRRRAAPIEELGRDRDGRPRVGRSRHVRLRHHRPLAMRHRHMRPDGRAARQGPAAARDRLCARIDHRCGWRAAWREAVRGAVRPPSFLVPAPSAHVGASVRVCGFTSERVHGLTNAAPPQASASSAGSTGPPRSAASTRSSRASRAVRG